MAASKPRPTRSAEIRAAAAKSAWRELRFLIAAIAAAILYLAFLGAS